MILKNQPRVEIIVERRLKSTAVNFDRSKLIKDPIEKNDRLTENNRTVQKMTEK